MLRVNAKVIETLTVMAKYNPFFKNAGMMSIDYKRDDTSIEKKIRAFLEGHDFDFDFLRSETYCCSFFSKLSEQDKKLLLAYLSEFARQPFIKIEKVSLNYWQRLFLQTAPISTGLSWRRLNDTSDRCPK